MSNDITLPAYPGKHLPFLISIDSAGKRRRRRRAAVLLIATSMITIAATLWIASQ